MRKSRLAVLPLCLFLAACGPAAPTAGAIGTDGAPAAQEPAKTIVSDPITLAIPAAPDAYDLLRHHFRHLQELSRKVGWNVTLQPYTVDDGDPYEMLFDAIKTQAASGQAADAYLVWGEELARRLCKDGLTRDMTDVLPRAAPMLWDACKGAFAGKVTGVPTMLSFTTKQGPLVFVLSAEQLALYGRPIANAGDVLAYVEEQPNAVLVDTASLWSPALLDAWAAWQGYYALDDYGLPEGFYARMDDAACTVVPLEDISGFTDFFQRYLALKAAGRVDDGNGGSKLENPGVLMRMGRYADPRLQVLTGLQGKDLTALPLEGCVPAPSLDAPSLFGMLAVTAASARADAVAAFVQWALLDAQGYALCTLGEQNIDYRLVDGLVEYLNDGQPLTQRDWAGYPLGKAFFNHERVLVYNPALRQFTVYEVGNAADVFAQYRPAAPPLWRARALRASEYFLRPLFDTATRPYPDLLAQRRDDIHYSVTRIDGVPQTTAEQVLHRLLENRSQLDPLVQDLQRRVNELLENRE